MPSKKPVPRLEDILDSIARIERFTAEMDFAAFQASELALYASLHALLILSEAARKLGSEAGTLVPGQPWADIRSIGNVLRHDYDSVAPETGWQIIRNGDLAALKLAVADALERLRR